MPSVLVNSPSITSPVRSCTSRAPPPRVIGWVTRSVPPSYRDMLPRSKDIARASSISFVIESARKEELLNRIPEFAISCRSSADHLPSA